MSEFSNNLQFYRKKNNLTQEALAEKLEVSRQTISKWEAETTYPEMDKILQLCNLFGCDIDTLLRGEAEDVDVETNKKYDREMKSFRNAITFATFLVLTGVATLILLHTRGLADNYAAAIFFVFLIVAVLLYITSGIQFATFKKKHPHIVPFYTEKEKDKVEHFFPIQISAGVGIVLVGLILLILNSEQEESILLIATAVFMEFIAISILFFIPAGMNAMRMNIEEYNKEYSNDPEIKEKARKTDAWSGVIFLTATIIFLVTGLVYQMWNINWIVFVVAALLSGIVSQLVDVTSKRKNN